MPYNAGNRLPGERASRLGHLDVLKSPLVKELCERFEQNTVDPPPETALWEPLPFDGEVLPVVFGIDGSLQVIRADTHPHMTLAFVKTAMVLLDQYALSQVDQDTPHPFALRDILSQSAQYHSTVFPLRHVSLSGMRNYDAVRQIIYESLKDQSLEGEPFETLKWLIYEKWDGRSKVPAPFHCPHCEEFVATLAYDADEGNCPNPACQGKLFVTDFLGFHQDMSPDATPDTIAKAYMTIHETLLLFTGVRYFWEYKRQALDTCLFVKDGPLALFSQYSKLVEPIRRFLEFAKAQNQMIYIVGQEKTGRFAEHLELISKFAQPGSFFLPDSTYIAENLQHRTGRRKSYGEDTYYGAKVFIKLNEYHAMVLSIPTGLYVADPTWTDLIGWERICASLPHILSHRYEGALLPLELAHHITSLSTYPSAPILKLFAESLQGHH
jgi:hypothetical protein